MRIVVDINHPAHVHYFKNFIWEMEKKGHEVLITATDKDIALRLLDIYGFDYIKLGSYGKSLVRKAVNLPLIDIKMYRAIKPFNPDVILGFGSIRGAQVSKLMGKYGIIFDDDEYSYPFYYPFADIIVGFSGFKKSGQKIIKINTYKELAYLHPNYFKPDYKVLRNAGISRNEEFALIRFVAWEAFHDVGKQGFTLKMKRMLINKLKEYVNVFITSEKSLPKEFEKYRLPVQIDKIHHLLYYAKLLVCDSQTMTTEAAVLGTPAIRSNSFVGDNDMGNFVELERRYGLIFNYKNAENAILKAIELAQKTNIKKIWNKKRQKLLNEKIDITSFMIWLISEYPDSIHNIRDNPEIQYKFR